MRAPKVLALGMANNLRTKKGQRRGIYCCNVTIFAHFWVDNRSSSNLMFYDRPADLSVMGLPSVRDASDMHVPASISGALPLSLTMLRCNLQCIQGSLWRAGFDWSTIEIIVGILQPNNYNLYCTSHREAIQVFSSYSRRDESSPLHMLRYRASTLALHQCATSVMTDDNVADCQRAPPNVTMGATP